MTLAMHNHDISAVPIVAMEHPQATITQILTPNETASATYVIIASSFISEVSHFVFQDNRLVVDIHNAVVGEYENLFVDDLPLTVISFEPDITRVVFDFAEHMEYSISLSADRMRLVVSFAPNTITRIITDIGQDLDALMIQGTVMSDIAICTEGFPHYLTVNFDNTAMVAGNGFFLGGNFGTRYETGQREDGSAYINIFLGQRQPDYSIVHGTSYAVITLYQAIPPFEPIIVVIDPGHGGADPGAIHFGIIEKHLVFDVSMKLMQLLNANPLIRAYSTRYSDIRLSNERRVEIANNIGADIFISIHANAAFNRNAHGIETWYTIGELELEGTHNLNSHQLATVIQRNLIRHTGANDRGIRVRHNMVVNRDSEMPSALVELGFLSNRYEAERLRVVEYQWLLAEALYNGIIEVLMTYFYPISMR
jgi:N-acetylmuramoyl-L-alanine amidase